MPYGHKETCRQLLHSAGIRALSARKILQFIIDIIWQFCLKQELTVIHWHGKMILKWATNSGNYCPDKQRAHSSYWSYVGKMLREQYHTWVDLSQACLEMKAHLDLVETEQSPSHNGGTWFLFHFWRDNHESNNLWKEFAAISPVAQLFEKEFLATICWSTGRGRTTLAN